MPAWLGWVVLALVFVDELLAFAALGVTGRHLGGWPVGLLLVLAALVVWGAFAAPRATRGGRFARMTTKLVVFGAAVAGLFWLGLPRTAFALLVFSLHVNVLAMAPSVARLVPPAPR